MPGIDYFFFLYGLHYQNSSHLDRESIYIHGAYFVWGVIPILRYSTNISKLVIMTIFWVWRYSCTEMSRAELEADKQPGMLFACA